MCREEDVICRIGGEEFAVILPDAGEREAVAVAERLREAIGRCTIPGDGRVTVSVGVAEFPRHTSQPRDLLARADAALFEAKAAGKDRVAVAAVAPDRATSKDRDP
jgi:diguanylate cyclase (GGDEF)-like protein